MPKPTCVFCGEAVNPEFDFRKVEGWERNRRSAGGTNAIRLRVQKDEWAHKFCIDKMARGIPANQGGLF